MKLIESKCEDWDQVINCIHNERSSVEHNDAYFPAMDSLNFIRTHAPNFAEWMLGEARKYHKASSGFSFAQEFVQLARWYTGESDANIAKYGDKAPHSIERYEEEEYNLLKVTSERLYSRLSKINAVDKLTKEDLTDLLMVVKQTERLDARETAFLRFGICPKCGAKIINSEHPIGGSSDDPPSAITYRTGCEKCDYELNSETIDI